MRSQNHSYRPTPGPDNCPSLTSNMRPVVKPNINELSHTIRSAKLFFMRLPHPQSKLAGCCWLPRIAAKCRVFLRGEMPRNYRIAFGSRAGIDGYFLRHFHISLPQLLAAVKKYQKEDELSGWFLSCNGVTDESIDLWNRLAPRIGARGTPGYWTRQIVKWFLYPKSVREPVNTIFEAIVQDENLPKHAEQDAAANP